MVKDLLAAVGIISLGFIAYSIIANKSNNSNKNTKVSNSNNSKNEKKFNSAGCNAKCIFPTDMFQYTSVNEVGHNVGGWSVGTNK